MLIGITFLVLGFQDSSSLAAAYGIAVTGTFAIDTILVFVVMRARWRLHLSLIILGMTLFLFIDLAYFGANAVKIPDGGWLPLIVALTVFTLLMTWRRGREIVLSRLNSTGIPLESFLPHLTEYPPHRVPGTAVFMTADPKGTPSALLHNLKHNKVLHERVIILNVRFREIPYAPDKDRLEMHELGPGFYPVIVHYGFMDNIDLPQTLAQCHCGKGLLEMMDTTFFYSRENLIPTHGAGMMIWREHIFAAMARSAASPMTYFRIPANRVVELGAQVEI